MVSTIQTADDKESILFREMAIFDKVLEVSVVLWCEEPLVCSISEELHIALSMSQVEIEFLFWFKMFTIPKDGNTGVS